MRTLLYACIALTLVLPMASAAPSTPSAADADVVNYAIVKCAPYWSSAQSGALGLPGTATATASFTMTSTGAYATAAASGPSGGFASSASATGTSNWGLVTRSSSASCSVTPPPPPNGGSAPDVDDVRFGCTTRGMGDSAVAYDGRVLRGTDGTLWFSGTRTVGGQPEAYETQAGEDGFLFTADPDDAGGDAIALPSIDAGSFTASPERFDTGMTLHAGFTPSFSAQRVRVDDVCDAGNGWAQTAF